MPSFTRALVAALAVATLLTAGAARAEPDFGGDYGRNPGPRAEQLSFHELHAVPLDMVYEFRLRGRHDAFVSAALIDPAGTLVIPDAMITLWRGDRDDDPANDVLIGGFDFGAMPTVQMFSGLAAGRYYWRLEGTVSGSGHVMFSTAVAPVPH